MIDVVLPEFSVYFDDFLPDEQHFSLRPVVIPRLFAILYDVEQTALEIFEYDDKGVESASAEDEEVKELWMVDGEVDADLVESLFEPHIPETVEFYDFSKLALLFVRADMEQHLCILLVVRIKYRT